MVRRNKKNWKHKQELHGCSRCGNDFERNHPLEVICKECLEKNPKLTSEEKTRMNLWDNIDDVYDVVKLSRERKWSWARNFDCKYLSIRLDMRDGGCIIETDNGKRIGPDALRWQYSDESQKRPLT